MSTSPWAAPYKDYIVEDDRIPEQSTLWPNGFWGLGERIFEALAVVASIGLLVGVIIWVAA